MDLRSGPKHVKYTHTTLNNNFCKCVCVCVFFFPLFFLNEESNFSMFLFFGWLVGFYFRECAKIMVNFHQKSGTGKLTGVYKKYSTSKYGYAAKSSEPAIFLMDGEDEDGDDDDETRIIQPTTSLAEVNDV